MPQVAISVRSPFHLIRDPHYYVFSIFYFFAEKESQKSTRLFFDISSLSPFETILHAELHIQIKRTPLPPEVQWNNVRPHWSGLSANPNRTTVYVFQQSGSSVENRRLLTSAELAPGATTSTHVLQIGSAVRDWIYQPRDNHGKNLKAAIVVPFVFSIVEKFSPIVTVLRFCTGFIKLSTGTKWRFYRLTQMQNFWLCLSVTKFCTRISFESLHINVRKKSKRKFRTNGVLNFSRLFFVHL